VNRFASSVWFVLLLTAAAGGCSSSGSPLAPGDDGGLDTITVLGPDGDSGDAGGDGASCDPSVTYASFGMAFFTTYCGRCHQWDQGSAQTAGDVLTLAAGPGGFMPPADPRPTDAERARLAAWVACGAP